MPMKPGELTKTCLKCGKVFNVKYRSWSGSRKKYCSRVCLHAMRQTRQVTETTRRCRTCGEVKNVQEFHGFIKTDRAGRPKKRYYFSDCRPCQAENTRKSLYGVTLAEMIAKQGSPVCPLCEKRIADSLDHDHATGKARGALCRKCNLIMHYVDDRAWMERAERYRASPQ